MNLANDSIGESMIKEFFIGLRQLKNFWLSQHNQLVKIDKTSQKSML
jgi:hypothetical protein